MTVVLVWELDGWEDAGINVTPVDDGVVEEVEVDEDEVEDGAGAVVVWTEVDTTVVADVEVVVVIEMGPGPCDGVLGNLEVTTGGPDSVLEVGVTAAQTASMTPKEEA